MIQEYEKQTTQFGDSCILTIKTKDSEESAVVWAPQRLTNKLLTKQYDFVLNEGLVKSNKTGNQYFKFSLM